MSGRLPVAPLSIGLALLLVGCAPTIIDPALPGRWGGEHVGLELGAAGGTLEYDCAAGTINGPLLVGKGGNFTAAGRHMPGTGGPARIGDVARSFPARYSGRVSGDTMTLMVDVAALGARIGPYTLRRGAQPNLLRCL